MTDDQRFIPVGAGNSPLAMFTVRISAVYPRGCGELHRGQRRQSMTIGLSPWVRGTLVQVGFQLGIWRFIPVGAGNSVTSGKLQWLICGLSPWVRGTLLNHQNTTDKFRFIPVGAGNSDNLPTWQPARPVYPRGCGELDGDLRPVCHGSGLSPWVRGTLVLNPAMLPPGRFIPVGAGNSTMTKPSPLLHTVYPRGCGELIFCWWPWRFVRGLSPWVRGTRLPIRIR